MTNCPRIYKNLGVESFGNRKKVTAEMLAQMCRNDSYLYGKVKELFDLTDPETRKRHFYPFIDESKSFNITGINNEYYDFSNETDDEVEIYFKDDASTTYNYKDYIDEDKSTLEIDPATGLCHIPLDNIDVTVKETQKQTVKKTVTTYGKTVKDSYYEGPYGAFAPNGTWYAGYNYLKPYNVKSAWKKDPFNSAYKIPSLSRGQTFKALHTGKLVSVTLNVRADKKTAYPLRVEIRETDKKGYPSKKILAYTTKKFNHTGMKLESFTFKSAPTLTKGKTYAIVIRCPLAIESASYHIAGWQKMCYNKNATNALKTARTNKGVRYSFESRDNCNTWLKYNAGDGAGYKNSLKNPVAFGYELKIKPSTTKTTETEEEITVDTTETVQARKTGEYHLYFKPLRYYNVSEFWSRISGISRYDPDYVKITHHVSNDGKNWYKNEDVFDDTGISQNFSNGKDYVFYRITIELLKNDIYSENNPTGWKPVINNKPNPQTITDPYKDNFTFQKIEFRTDFNKALKGYCRTLQYYPVNDEMLPACIWSEFNSNYENNENTNVEIDIIRDKEEQLIVHILQPTLVDLRGYEVTEEGITRDNYKTDYIGEYNGTLNPSNPDTDEKVLQAVSNSQEFRKWLFENYNIFVYGVSDVTGITKYMDSTIQLPNYLAYPVIDCSLAMEELTLYPSDFTSIGNTLLFSEKVHNFEQQIQKVYIHNISTGEDVDLKDGWEERTSSGEYTTQAIILKEFNKGEHSSENPEWYVGGSTSYALAIIYNSGLSDYFTQTSEAITLNDGYVIKVVFNENDMIEGIDYEIDYDNATMRFFNQYEDETANEDDDYFLYSLDTFQNGYLTFTYTPLWVRGLTKEDLPIPMDLWIEQYKVTQTGIDKIYFDDDGQPVTIESYPKNNNDYQLFTSVDAVDNLREVLVDEETDEQVELIEDKDFTVDYIKRLITFKDNVIVNNKKVFDFTKKPSYYLTVRYTPDLRDLGLGVGYRISRQNDTESVKIKNYYFTTRT